MKITLVVPVFNEQAAVNIFYNSVRSWEWPVDIDVDIIFVNDGSTDNTEIFVKELVESDSQVNLISFSRNFGKEAALMAGLEYADGDAVIPIDVDLQDPIDVIPLLIEKWRKGADVVLAKRISRSSDNFLKRETAKLFYIFHNKISQPKIEENVGDFRLMSRHVVDAILQLPERNLFMKGVLSWVGFSTEIVEYDRAPRSAGTSKFSGWKLWKLAVEGITSFSTLPLQIWTYLGLVIASLSIFYSLWMVIDKIIWGNPIPGYPSLMSAILFLGGVQLVGIGVLGEYIGRIYIETKQRPRYLVRYATKPVRRLDGFEMGG